MHPTDAIVNDYIDGSLDPVEQAAVDQHLDTCAACRQIVADVRDLLRAAGDLELREPPVRAWSRLERAIRLEPGFDGEARDSRLGPEVRDSRLGQGVRGFQPNVSGADQTWGGPFRAASAGLRVPRHILVGLAAAAALVLAVAVGIRYAPGLRGGARTVTDASEAPNRADAAEAIESELRQAETHYEKAITGLEAIANSDRGDLDPRTAATLRKNLAVIDQAINESRAAVRSQPDSEPAQHSLIEGFKTKIGLLQDTVALINEMRKGNEAGAARIASGLKQKGT